MALATKSYSIVGARVTSHPARQPQTDRRRQLDAGAALLIGVSKRVRLALARDKSTRVRYLLAS